MIKIAGMKLVGELPKSDKPWKMALMDFGDGSFIIAVNPEHPPHIIKDGKVSEFTWSKPDAR